MKCCFLNYLAKNGIYVMYLNCNTINRKPILFRVCFPRFLFVVYLLIDTFFERLVYTVIPFLDPDMESQAARISSAFSKLRDIIREDSQKNSTTTSNDSNDESVIHEDTVVDEETLVNFLKNERTRKSACTMYFQRKAETFFESGCGVQLDPNAPLHAKGV